MLPSRKKAPSSLMSNFSPTKKKVPRTWKTLSCTCCNPTKTGSSTKIKRNGTENSPVFLLHMRLKIYVDVMPAGLGGGCIGPWACLKFYRFLRHPSYSKSTHQPQ